MKEITTLRYLVQSARGAKEFNIHGVLSTAAIRTGQLGALKHMGFKGKVKITYFIICLSSDANMPLLIMSS